MKLVRSFHRNDHVSYDALFDPTTRLVRMPLLRDRLEVALTRAERRHRLVGVLFVRVDVPDDLVSVGNRSFDILPLIAGRLRSAVRPDDTVARVGDLDFVVVCNDLSSTDDVVAIMDRLRSVISVRVFLDESKSLLSAQIRTKVAKPKDHAVDLLVDGGLEGI